MGEKNFYKMSLAQLDKEIAKAVKFIKCGELLPHTYDPNDEETNGSCAPCQAQGMLADAVEYLVGMAEEMGRCAGSEQKVSTKKPPIDKKVIKFQPLSRKGNHPDAVFDPLR